MTPAAPSAPRIGVFDSGVGGLSVLRELKHALPSAQLLYVADSGHAPYGERDEAFVIERSRRIAAFLRRHGAGLLVVACNTATAAAVQALRDEPGSLPIVGIEPGVKPAAALTRSGHVGVMATGGTLNSERFRALAAAHAGGVTLHLQACTGLAAGIESADLDTPSLRALVERHCTPLREAGCDVVVLGCTHYPFVADTIRTALGGGRVTLIDTAAAVARRAAALAGPMAAAPGAQARLRMWTSGEPQRLDAFAERWLGWAVRAEPLDA